MAAEAYTLYPENPAHLAGVAGDPAHRFFRKFGEAMPAADWNAAGSKQGVYMIGPDAEYLEGRSTASDGADVRQRLERAVARWQDLRKQRKYANKPVPARGTDMPPAAAAAKHVLRVSMRDLAGAQPDATVRWRPGAFDDANWFEFTRWAWNQDWHAVDDLRVLVPAGAAEVDVDAEFVRRLCREVFVDRVRGQAPPWQEPHVRQATLRMRRGRANGKLVPIEYSGSAEMDDGDHGVRVRFAGRGEYEPATKQLRAFTLVATGLRRGGYPSNQRAQMLAPSPIGFALRLHTATDDDGKR